MSADIPEYENKDLEIEDAEEDCISEPDVDETSPVETESTCEHFLPRRTFLQSPITQIGLIAIGLKMVDAWVVVTRIKYGKIST